MPVQADNILLPADPRTRHHHSFKFKHVQYKHSFFCQNSNWVELSSWSLRQRGYHHRIPDAAPLHALSGVHTPPIVVIRESGLTIIVLELELELAIFSESLHTAEIPTHWKKA